MESTIEGKYLLSSTECDSLSKCGTPAGSKSEKIYSPTAFITAINLDGDKVFKRLTLVFAFSVIIILFLMLYEMITSSLPAILKFRASFITGRDWDVPMESYGALPFIFGSTLTSFLAITIATPLGVAAAVFVNEMAPRRIGEAVASMVELLAAIPSVIYGLWGVTILAPFLQKTLQPFLSSQFGYLPFFSGPAYGVSIFAAVIILVIMILPIITAITRQVLSAVPDGQREAAIALGATKWEMIRMAVLPYGKSGILGAVILALGRAIGETMAVTMVIGNTPAISWSLFSPGYTMPSVIANEFAEASNALHTSALMEIGLLLLFVTLVVNAFARLMLWGMSKNSGQGRIQ